jgi:hypothetical protein
MAEHKGEYLSAEDFLAAIAGELIDHELKVNGRVVGKVQLRTLEFAAVQTAASRFANAPGELMLWALDNALVNPVLTDAQREQVRRGKPMPLLDLAQHVMQISGMTEEEGGSPLDGGS